MFHVKNHKQLNIVDPWAHLGPKRRKLLDSSWAGLFQQHILPQLPVESLRRHYHDCHGRPTKELYAMMGLMVLQQMHDCTDREAVEQFCFNIQWHYALNITSFWLFVVSSGFEELLDRRCQQVDDADELVIVAVPPGPAFGGLKDAVERFEASVAVA